MKKIFLVLSLLVSFVFITPYAIFAAPEIPGSPGNPGNPGAVSPGEQGKDPGDESNPLGKGDCKEEELYTAIGCIPISNWDSIVSQIIKIALGVAGGVAFALILVAGFMIMTSQGDPKRLSAGQELLTSAIMGLLLLIFSVYILTIIGVKILEIPGLT